MPEKQDHTQMDYFYAANAQSNPIGDFVSLQDSWGWSVTLACQGGAKGTLFFQCSDFDAKSGLTFPFLASGAVGQDQLSIVATGATYWRMGKAYDGIWNTARWLRMYWSDNASPGGATLYVSLNLKHQ